MNPKKKKQKKMEEKIILKPGGQTAARSMCTCVASHLKRLHRKQKNSSEPEVGRNSDDEEEGWEGRRGLRERDSADDEEGDWDE